VVYGGAVPLRPRHPAVALAALLLGLALPSAAAADEVTAHDGQVKATLSYTKGEFAYTADSLRIERAGQVLYDAAPVPPSCRDIGCSPTIDGTPLEVRDLDSDGEPEVLVSFFTGGAHCCSVLQVFRLSADAGDYLSAERFFGNSGYAIEDVEGDGTPELFSSDDAFAYRFTAYVFSGRPLLILRFDHGNFTDVTSAYPRLIRADARGWWRGYRELRKEHDGSAKGQIAAWAADQYRLGKRAYARRILRREARRGYFGKPKRARRFIKVLDQFLHRRGYV
jgi:hypothetical protein